MTRTWSQQQEAIFEHFSKSKQNLVIVARAGVGKTTTCEEGVFRAPDAQILAVAFNKIIAEELVERFKRRGAVHDFKTNTHRGPEAKSLNSLGYSYCRKAWPGCDVDTKRGWRIAERICGEWFAKNPKDKELRDELLDLIKRLAEKGKECAPLAKDGRDLRDLALDFDCLPSEELETRMAHGDPESATEIAAVICQMAYQAMMLATEREEKPTVDFADQIFLPVRLGWVRPYWTLVVVDEAQDLNLSQLLLAQKACKSGGRIVVVGDDKQAIYGWRGADSDSLNRLKRELRASELKLTTTYRCPKRVVELAQKLVPDFEAHPDAPEGSVQSLKSTREIVTAAKPGDFVLSRKKAPLVPLCLNMLRQGVKAKIRGQDIEKGLVALINRLKAKSVKDLLTKLAAWEAREVERVKAAFPGDEKKQVPRITEIEDRAETLRFFMDGCKSIQDAAERLKGLFSDDNPQSFVMLSTVHKAKGLEADRVFLLESTLYPGGRTQDPEEKNIHYVAMTRAKKELILVQKEN